MPATTPATTPDDQRRQVQSPEKVKELEEQLKQKEKELAAARAMNETLMEKLVQLGRRQAEPKGAKAGQASDRASEKVMNTLKDGLLDVNERLQKLEHPSGGDDKGNPPADPDQPVYLKFTFNPLSDTVLTEARATTGYVLDDYTFARGCRWPDICPPERTLALGLRHGSTVIRGGRSVQVFDAPFRAAPAPAPAPTVLVWLTGVSMSPKRPWRVRCWAESVSATQFAAVVEASGDASLEEAGVAWVAYEREKAGVCSHTWAIGEGGWLCPITDKWGKLQKQSALGDLGRSDTMAAVNELVMARLEVGFEMALGVGKMERWEGGRIDKSVGWSLGVGGDVKPQKVGCVGLALEKEDREEDTCLVLGAWQ